MFNLNQGGLFAAICGNGENVVMENVVLFFAFFLLSIAAGYLLGSVNTAIVISKVFFKDDIRKYGSGNAGMTNMLRTFGGKAALGVLFGDMLKTALSICIGGVLFGFGYIGGFSMGYNSAHMLFMGIGTYTAGLAAVLGHIFPVYYGFRGGKGVLCVATAIALLSPMAFVLALITFIIIVSFTKYVSLGSIFAALMLPLFADIENRIIPIGGIDVLIAVIMALVVVWCHRENIKRIRAGKDAGSP